jgi:hypothetical protein
MDGHCHEAAVTTVRRTTAFAAAAASAKERARQAIDVTMVVQFFFFFFITVALTSFLSSSCQSFKGCQSSCQCNAVNSSHVATNDAVHGRRKQRSVYERVACACSACSSVD